MISRYDEKEISELWTDKARFETMLEVELAILKALEGDIVKSGTSDIIKKNAIIDTERIHEIEKETRHDVIAFCTSITENLDAEVGKFFHYGVTSSDIIDSAMTLQIKRSLDLIIKSFEQLLDSLMKKAEDSKGIITIGRSHGMFAEPLSFGQKLLGHYSEFKRRLDDLKSFYDNDLTVQFSGAVGSYTILTPQNELEAAKSLGLNVEPVSTQVIPRDRIAKLISITSLTGAAIERIAVEIRHLHRSDVNELFEGFAKGQKGSSTMPHKKNPISGENLTGMARMLRSQVQIATDNIILWHERDISHSSAERFMLPDAFGILFYSIKRLTNTIDNLVINQEEMERKVRENFTYLSSFYLHKLIEKTELKREELYTVVQKASFDASESNDVDIFYNSIMNQLSQKNIDLELPRPTFEEIKKIFMAHVDTVFQRVKC